MRGSSAVIFGRCCYFAAFTLRRKQEISRPQKKSGLLVCSAKVETALISSRAAAAFSKPEN